MQAQMSKSARYVLSDDADKSGGLGPECFPKTIWLASPERLGKP